MADEAEFATLLTGVPAALLLLLLDPLDTRDTTLYLLRLPVVVDVGAAAVVVGVPLAYRPGIGGPGGPEAGVEYED